MKSNFVVLVAFLATLPASALDLQPGPDGGFLTAWQVLGPVSSKAVPELLGAPLDGPRWTTVASPGPTVDAGKARRAKRGQSTLFALTVRNDTPAAIDGTLYLGSDGGMTVWLDRSQIAAYERPYRTLFDDRAVPIRIAPGAHTLTLETRHQGTEGAEWRIAARLQDSRGKSPVGLTFSLPDSVKAEGLAADATSIFVDRAPIPEGYRTTVEVRPTGSGPKGLWVPWVLAVSGIGTVAQGKSGDAPKRFELKLPKDGEFGMTLTVGPRTRFVQRIAYRKRWHSLLAEARADFVRATGLDRGAVDSLQWNLEELERHVVDNIPDTRWLDGQVDRLRGWMATAAKGGDPLKSMRGDFYRAYRSPYDGRLQAYSIHVPPRYDGKLPWPMVVGMHGIGSGSHYTLRRVLGKDRDKEGGEADGKPMIRGNMPALPDYGVITISAWGYHNSAYWFYGEDDVLRIADETKRAYAIDDDRVYLTGLSLGGLGTYHIGHHYPDRFAALGPLGGFSSIKLYREIRSAAKTPWEHVLIEQRDATSYAENGLHTPMSVVHGRFDNPAHAKAMTKRYEALGYRYELDIPELPHDVWQYSYGEGKMVKWLKRWTRPRAPKDITFKTQSYRYISAYWAHVDWIDDYTKPALLKLSVNAAGTRIVFNEFNNIRGLTLDLSKPKLAAEPVEIVLPGNVVLRTEKRDKVHLRRDRDHWTFGATGAPPAGYKRPGTSGPLDDIMFEPHVFVAGTQDPNQTDTNRRLIEDDRRYLRHVDHDIAFPTVDDVAVSPADLKSKNLVLYGNPKSNSVLAAAVATGALPLRFEDHALVVGARRFEGDDVGVKLIYKSPWNPDRYILVVAGVTRRGTLLSRHLPRFLPDLVVYDERITAEYGGRLLDKRPVRFGGFFDADWSVPKELE